MRSALLLLAGCLAAVAAAVAVAAADERELAFTLDVRPAGPVAALERGAEACERGVPVPAGFDDVEVLLGTYARPGPPLEVTVRRGRELARGRLPAGARDNQAARVRVTPRVGRGGAVDVCVRNLGPGRVALYGAPDREVPGPIGELGGRPLDADLRLRFMRAEPRSALALVPDMFERAALFRPVGAWAHWALLALVAVGIPLLLVSALVRAGVTRASSTRYAADQGGQPEEPVS